MPAFVEDPIAWPTMVKLAACLCTTLEDRGLPGTCQCTPVPGPLAVMESCGKCKGTGSEACGGQGWVRFVNEFPSRQFPQPDSTSANCDTPLAYVLEVGVARCLPTGNSNSISGYTGPTMEQLMDATRLQLADKAAMVAAIKCCLAGEDDISYVLGQYQTIQTAADCGGGMWTVTIWGV